VKVLDSCFLKVLYSVILRIIVIERLSSLIN
jgi:hypothetical protein